MILENTLHQCSEKRITQLYIDLSGVAMIDTMVAQQLFTLIESLGMLGVKATLSGIRPEIAQTAVQLGLSFSNLSIRSSLAEAIASDLTKGIRHFSLIPFYQSFHGYVQYTSSSNHV